MGKTEETLEEEGASAISGASKKQKIFSSSYDASPKEEKTKQEIKSSTEPELITTRSSKFGICINKHQENIRKSKQESNLLDSEHRQEKLSFAKHLDTKAHWKLHKSNSSNNKRGSLQNNKTQLKKDKNV